MIEACANAVASWRPPDYEGKAGRVWRYALSAAMRETYPHWLAGALIHSLLGSKVYPWKTACLLSLDPSSTTAIRHFAGARYEIVTVSIDPRFPLPGPDAPNAVCYLEPIDIVYQLPEIGQACAKDGFGRVLDMMAHGDLVPEPEFRARWFTELSSVFKVAS